MINVWGYHFTGVVQAIIQWFVLSSFVARQSRVALGVFWARGYFRWLRRLGFKPSFLFQAGVYSD